MIEAFLKERLLVKAEEIIGPDIIMIFCLLTFLRGPLINL